MMAIPRLLNPFEHGNITASAFDDGQIHASRS